VTAPPVVSAAQAPEWAELVDVVVAGTGGSGLTAAVMAAEAGARVVVLEKGAGTGGTTHKSGGGVWVPRNHHMEALGLPDSRDGALRYMARTARPHLYAPDAPHLGLPESEHDLLCAFVDEGGTAFAALEEMGALSMLALADFPNYYCAIEEDVHKLGRTLGPREPGGAPGDGPEMIRQLTAALEQRGGRILVEHRVSGAVVDGEDVVGVVAATPEGERWFRASRAVILATGGFTHNAALRRSHLRGPVFGGCAATTNEGDIVPIAQALGAEMASMSEAWNVPIGLERALAGDPTLTSTFNIVGSSMLCVNRHGRRAMNEKAVYNEATVPMLRYDGVRCEYPNMLMFAVWDQANYDAFRGSPFDGGLMPAIGADDTHVIAGATFADLARGLDERLATLQDATGGVRLAEDFAAQLAASVARFGELARRGRDDDFGRGATAVERHMHKLCVNAARMGTDSGMTAMLDRDSAGWAVPVEPEQPGAGNPTMAPLAGEGPYYAAILAPGTLDTKGGPRVDRHGRVLRAGGEPIAGLYAVGNCAASPTGQAYWGAGGTLGPMITYAWLAGQHAGSLPAR
jgi:succinate dehydrogenase/fumarate reductase flavoprotein subunit